MTIGKPMFAAPVYRSVVWVDAPVTGAAMKVSGCASMRTPPWMSFVPDFVTALTIAPEVRPNSAEMPPFLMLTSAMSSSFVSTCR